jgi:hypothetical protein
MIVIDYKEHTNFLGVWLDKNLRWTVHTQQLTNKLGKICFTLRVIKRVAGLETVHTSYYANFHLLLHGLVFWDNSGNEKVIFRMQKRAIRAMVQMLITLTVNNILKRYIYYLYQVRIYTRIYMKF